MLTIPSGQAARKAWTVLPPEVRAEVKQYADRFEGHPDPAVAAVAVGLIRAEAERPWRLHPITHAAMAVFLGVYLAGHGQSTRNPTRRVSVGENGVRFGRPWILSRTPTVPWKDVVDVTLAGPDRFRPGEPGAMVWHLRDGLRVRVALHASRPQPEELILVARSFMAAASVARTA
jgi:hypothetical protein